jgi:hypothetical protein
MAHLSSMRAAKNAVDQCLGRGLAFLLIGTLVVKPWLIFFV